MQSRNGEAVDSTMDLARVQDAETGVVTGVWSPTASMDPLERRRIMARYVVSELGLDTQDPRNDAYVRQAGLFLEAMEIMVDKGESYGHSYQSVGWKGCLLDLHRKLRRLMHAGWWRHTPQSEHSLRDNAVDSLNHIGFFVQCLDEGNVWGREF